MGKAFQLQPPSIASLLRFMSFLLENIYVTCCDRWQNAVRERERDGHVGSKRLDSFGAGYMRRKFSSTTVKKGRKIASDECSWWKMRQQLQLEWERWIWCQHYISVQILFFILFMIRWEMKMRKHTTLVRSPTATFSRKSTIFPPRVKTVEKL